MRQHIFRHIFRQHPIRSATLCLLIASIGEARGDACDPNAQRSTAPTAQTGQEPNVDTDDLPPIDAKNVLGQPLQPCCFDPLTGFFRDGHCRTDQHDHGRHVVCAQVTDAFLRFSKAQGNDLITPRPEHRFPGLKAGDRWCLCALRWREAWEAGVAPPVILEATHEKALTYVPLDALQAHAVAPYH